MTYLGRRHKNTVSKNSVPWSLHIKACFYQQEKLSKKDSTDYIINYMWFSGSHTILHSLPNKNLLQNSVLRNFQIKAFLNQHSNWRKLTQIIMQLVISDLGWLILFCITCRTQIRRSFLQWHLLAILSLIINNKKRKKKEKKIKTFCKHLVRILVGFP